MTVAELIAKLSEMPQDMQVKAEGCDCINPVSEVTHEPVSSFGSPEYVLIGADLS